MLRVSTILGVFAVVAISECIAARKYKMVCYYGSWATYRNGNGRFTSLDIDPQLCTHMVYAFAGLDSRYQVYTLDAWLSDAGGLDDYGKFRRLKNSNPDLITMIGVGGWNQGSAAYSQMAATPKNRKTFIDSVIYYIRRNGFDGLSLDWHYPANRGGLAVDKRNYVTLLKELREALSAENLHLGVSVAGNIEIIQSGYDIPEVTKYVDYVSLLTYDYHGSWETWTGMNSPLYPHKGATAAERRLTQDATVQHWITNGADKSKLLLGLPTYGRTFILRDASRNKIGDPVFRPGNPGPFTQQDGLLGYNEIIEKFNDYDGWQITHDEDTKSPYAFNGELWISYDDPWSFGLKAEYIKMQGLGGAMIWSVETDDFRGVSGTNNPLMSTLKNVLEDGAKVTTPTTDNTNKTPGPPKSTIGIMCDGPAVFQHPSDCTRFITCILGAGKYVPVENNCPPGLAFDNVSKSCNWKDAVPECR